MGVGWGDEYRTRSLSESCTTVLNLGAPVAALRKRNFSLLFLVAMPLALGACRAPAGEVEFWAMGLEGEVVARMVPEFERLHPDVHVRVQQIPWSAAHEKLLTAYVGEATPCAFQLGNTWVPEFAALDALDPLEVRIRDSELVRPDDYFAGIYDTNVVGAHTFGVPWYVDTRLLFYRSDLLAQSGATSGLGSWESWLDAMQRIKREAGPSRYAILLPLTEWQTPVVLALQLGADLLRDGGRYGDFQSDAFRRAFDFYLGLFRDGLAPRRGDAAVGNVYQDFAAGFFAFYVTGPWNLSEFEKRMPPALGDAWATAPMPAPSGDGPGDSVAGGSSLAIFRRCAHKDAAWRWIEYLTAAEQQVQLYRLTGDLPSRPTAWKEADLVRNPHAVAFWEQLQHVRSTPKVPEWERIAGKIGQYAEAAIRGDITPHAALVSLDDDVDEILAKRRWMLARAEAGQK